MSIEAIAQGGQKIASLATALPTRIITYAWGLCLTHFRAFVQS
jgi:hypothetical protein